MRPPISGDEVMRELGIDPGPLVGKIMEALYEQRINEGLVSKEEALDLARETKKKESE